MPAKTAKLPRTQQELLDAMRGGVTLNYLPYAGSFNPVAYYFRSDNMKRCTAAAEALLRKGLVEKFNESWRGHRLRIAQPPAKEGER